MFERFTEPARQVVVEAQADARSLGHDWIGTEHLLLGIISGRSFAADVLARQGATPDTVRDAVCREVGVQGHHSSPTDRLGPTGEEGEKAALRDLGIDLDEIRRRVEATFGEGALDVPGQERGTGPRWLRLPTRRRHRARGCRGGAGRIRFTPRAKKALELALRESLRLKTGSIQVEHLLLGILREGEGLAAQVLVELGADLAGLRAETETHLRHAA